jgi:hypothetical protein
VGPFAASKNNQQGQKGHEQAEYPIWNNTIEEDTIRYSDLFAGGKGINVWPIVKDSTPTPCSWPF